MAGTTLDRHFPTNIAMSLLSRAITSAHAPSTITGAWLPFGEAAAADAPANNAQAVVVWSPAPAPAATRSPPASPPAPSPVWAPSPPGLPRAGQAGFLEALDRALEVAKAEIGDGDEEEEAA